MDTALSTSRNGIPAKTGYVLKKSPDYFCLACIAFVVIVLAIGRLALKGICHLVYIFVLFPYFTLGYLALILYFELLCFASLAFVLAIMLSVLLSWHDACYTAIGIFSVFHIIMTIKTLNLIVRRHLEVKQYFLLFCDFIEGAVCPYHYIYKMNGGVAIRWEVPIPFAYFIRD